MNQLSMEERTNIILLLAEGNGIRATARIADKSPVTVLKLLETVGKACQQYHDSIVRDIQPKQIQCDEIWSFVYAKDKTPVKKVPATYNGRKGYGDFYTWIAMDPKTKLVVCWYTGTRDSES